MLDTVQKIFNEVLFKSELNPYELENAKVTDRGDHFAIVVKDFIRDFDKINNLVTSNSINRIMKEYFDFKNTNNKLSFKSVNTHHTDNGKDYKYYNLKIDDSYELGKPLDWISVKFILTK